MKKSAKIAWCFFVGYSCGWVLFFVFLATISMFPVHYAITSWLSIAGKDPTFSYGICWLIGLFPPSIVIGVIASIAAIIYPAFV